MPLPVLQTKFYVPVPRPGLVARPQLVAQLAVDCLRPITLISAPAGFGKTTLLSAWISDLRNTIDDLRGGSTDEPILVNQKLVVEPSKIVNPQVTWLSLDEDDNDPVRFFTYWIGALQTCLPQVGATMLALLAAPQPPPLKQMLTLLLNELSVLSTTVVMVLDDYHAITAAPIHEALTFLLDHLPPTLRLIITSRVDPPLPLARWRVRQQLTEIRADDLRFSHAEIAYLLNEVLHFKLNAHEITQLEARTEGWIAGLHLAALSMQGRSDLADFIDHFTGSHAYIIDYLVEEVVQRQPETVQHFLLQTSILERLCAPLCDQLTGRSDSQMLLEQLQRANLFLVALDAERRWFRYHHLFAEVLRGRLRQRGADALISLHQRAAAWYEAAGLVDEALHHALAGPDWEQAALLVERYSIPLLLRSEVMRIRHWLQPLPVTLIESRPQLALVAAWTAMTARQLDELAHLLNDVPVLQRADLDEEMQSQLLILRACLALFQNDFAQVTSYAQQGLQLVPAHLPSLRATALLLLGSVPAQRNDWANAEPLLRETIAAGLAGNNLYNVMLAYHVISRLQSARGEISQALATLHEALQVATQQGQALLPAVGVIYIALGALWLEPERYAEAIATLQKGEELTKACFQFDVLLYGWQAQVKLHLLHDNLRQAIVVLDGAEAWLRQIPLNFSMRQGILQVLQSLRNDATAPEFQDQIQAPTIQNPKLVVEGSKIPNLIEPLSERELEILRLVNAGLSNSEIADQIIVTVGTVKKHLNNIFGKLGVGSRTQALVRAREIQLL